VSFVGQEVEVDDYEKETVKMGRLMSITVIRIT
jgi:hypothetical protein